VSLGRLAGKPAALAVAAALFALFVAIVLPAESEKAAAHTPPGASFDLSFFYTPAQALDRAASYSTEGRFAYIAARWGFDLAWPAVYGFFGIAAWAFALARLPSLLEGGSPARSRRRRRALLVIPALGPVFDYAENIAATMLMASVPGRPLGWAVAASVATPLKWLFVFAGLGGSLVLPTIAAIRAARRRGGESMK
jgi:hypothetical protein